MWLCRVPSPTTACASSARVTAPGQRQVSARSARAPDRNTAYPSFRKFWRMRNLRALTAWLDPTSFWLSGICGRAGGAREAGRQRWTSSTRGEGQQRWPPSQGTQHGQHVWARAVQIWKEVGGMQGAALHAGRCCHLRCSQPHTITTHPQAVPTHWHPPTHPHPPTRPPTHPLTPTLRSILNAGRPKPSAFVLVSSSRATTMAFFTPAQHSRHSAAHQAPAIITSDGQQWR